MKGKKEDRKAAILLIGIVLFIAFCGIATATPGNVNYYWNLTNTSNSVDYLIISHDDFYLNVDLYRLAAWRAENNSFDVGIVNLSDVAYQFNETESDPANDTAIKNFIQYVYENWTKKERVNNDIFVLLVGDHAASGETDYMPSHESDLTDNNGNEFATDNWFADVNGSDRDPDVHIGRFSLKDNVNLSNMVNKTIKYENQMPTNKWHKKLLLINGRDIDDLDINNTNETFNAVKSVADPYDVFCQDIIAAYEGSTAATTTNIQENISQGYGVTSYHGGGNNNGWIYSGGSGFGRDNIPNLVNNDNLTVFLSFGCATAVINSSVDVFGERAIRGVDRGGVGFLGAYGIVAPSWGYIMDEWLFEAIFVNRSQTWGEAITMTKRHMGMGGTGHTTPLDIYNWIGDPALGIKDYRAPEALIHLPRNITTNSDLLNFSVTDGNLDSCWYSVNNGAENTSLTDCSNASFSLSDGSYRMFLWSNDSLGNENYTTRDFSYDTSYPEISLLSPDNSSTWTSSSRVNFYYNVSDAGLENCSLIVDDAITDTETNVTANETLSFTATLSNGAYNWSVKCTDLAGQENSSETYSLTVNYEEPPSTPGGGGSSSRSISSTETSETVTLTTGAKEGETKILSFSKDISITEIMLTFKNTVNRASMTVEKLTGNPEEILQTPEGLVYAYLKIDKDVNNEDIEKGKMKFKVEKSWLLKNGFLAEEVRLERYGTAWQALPTAKIMEDSDYIYYQAEAQGFSYFVILAEKTPAQIATAEATEEKEEEPEQQEREPEQKQEQEPTNLKALWYSIGLILTAFLVILLVKKRPGRKKKGEGFQLPSLTELLTAPKIRNFCKKKLKQGYKEEEIIEAARESGWREEKIKQILEELRK